ncbi:hypothetical protein L9F63_007466 [Diploptera punctata]|uniref:C2H2-type domain-containing protein n=1 Tax=Diploptera punctata TaxID=6984 RepID=A0AAD7Z8L4_DIPPU|nr:hypothetical protein L9F63_007466 [Diploptera punctata]
MAHAQMGNTYRCQMCPEQFVNSWSLTCHQKTHHSNSASLVQSNLPSNDKRRWTCKYCEKHNTNHQSLLIHMKMYHSQENLLREKKRWTCVICEKHYVSERSLLTHISMLHSGDNPGPKFQCPECGKRFAYKVSLYTHRKIHKEGKIHVCPICKKTFVHSSGLSTHLRLHQDDKPYSCEYCGKKFFRRGDKDDHTRKHTGERPFSCRHCFKTFRTRGMWSQHEGIHRDERPYQCEVCGATFRRSYVLKIHKNIHTEKSAIAAHSLLENHKIEKEALLLKHLEKPLELTIWEIIYIQKNKFRSKNFEIPDERDLISKFIKSTPDGNVIDRDSNDNPVVIMSVENERDPSLEN